MPYSYLKFSTAVTATSGAREAKLYSTDIKAKVVGNLKINKIVSSAATFKTSLNEECNEAQVI